jgi:hypothetical protein
LTAETTEYLDVLGQPIGEGCVLVFGGLSGSSKTELRFYYLAENVQFRGKRAVRLRRLLPWPDGKWTLGEELTTATFGRALALNYDWIEHPYGGDDTRVLAADASFAGNESFKNLEAAFTKARQEERGKLERTE